LCSTTLLDWLIVRSKDGAAQRGIGLDEHTVAEAANYSTPAQGSVLGGNI
jgi:hypothetical protein